MTRSSLKTWLFPFSILVGLALAVFGLTFWIDNYTGLGKALRDVWDPDTQALADTIGNAGEVVAAILGIAITVVAIIVELASNRYTHRITELFVREPINFAVSGFFVVTALQSLLVGLTFHREVEEIPYIGHAVAMGMLAFCLILLLPYFAFVFEFLNPIQIVARIREHTVRAVGRGRRQVVERQREAVRGVEQLADVGMNAMEHKDKGVSMASVDALRDMVLDYQALRAALPDEWFKVEGPLAHNPDFVSMSSEVLSAVSARRIWFEMKVMRKYQTIYSEALNKMRDINYLIAINTRHIGEKALEVDNGELFDLVVKFFNTYLRATINARDVRTAYNVLHQYRLLAESALHVGGGERAIEVARYFKYYGLVSFNSKLPFILETVAYDLCALNEIAFDEESPAGRELLHIFLQVDKESETEVQENSLRGVRKAQVKLATYYLLRGDEALAREVYRDMAGERRERLASIRDEFLGVTSSEFWEISDRGVNFDYLEPERKREMLNFFEWFGDLRAPVPTTRTTDPPPEIPLGPSQATPLHDIIGAGLDPGRPSQLPIAPPRDEDVIENDAIDA